MNTALLFIVGTLFLLNHKNIVNSYEPTCDDDTTCRRIFDCAKHVEQIKKLHLTNGVGHRNYLLGPVKSLTCGFEGMIPKICCPRRQSANDEIYNGFDNIRIRRMNLKSRSLSSDCGNFLWNKNLPADGAATDLYEFPWLALLQYENQSGKKLRCGGVLVNDRYVLTAAHCLHPSFRPTSVRLGEYDLRTDPDCFNDDPKTKPRRYCNDKTIVYGIETQIVHEAYRSLRGPPDFDQRSRDIGLLRLDRSVDFTDSIRPICLPGSEVSKNEVKYLSSGWGAMPIADYPKSDVKRMFRLDSIEKTSCDATYGRTLQRDVICAVPRVNNVGCIGDSGGPLMAIDKQSRMIVVGVYAPIGAGYCWTTDAPNTYTDVRQHYDWITEKMQ